MIMKRTIVSPNSSQLDTNMLDLMQHTNINNGRKKVTSQMEDVTKFRPQNTSEFKFQNSLNSTGAKIDYTGVIP